MRLHHIGIAVKDLEAAVAAYRGLDLLCVDREEVEGQKVRVAFLPVGESRLELLEPTDPEGAMGRFLESRGEGIHHICLEVEDIEAALRRAREAGVRLVDEKPRVGAGGAKVAFLHPKSLHGVLVELWQGGEKHE